MSLKKKKHPFEKNETGYHKFAVQQLAEWVGGEAEKQFKVDGRIVFVPDVVKDDTVYEIVYSHPIDGKKLGMMQYWCYRNSSEMTIFEVSADFILSQTKKPERIETLECYIIEYETIKEKALGL
jgi:hypothetical protein